MGQAGEGFAYDLGTLGEAAEDEAGAGAGGEGIADIAKQLCYASVDAGAVLEIFASRDEGAESGAGVFEKIAVKAGEDVDGRVGIRGGCVRAEVEDGIFERGVGGF